MLSTKQIRAIEADIYKKKSVLVIHINTLLLPNAKNQDFNTNFFCFIIV